MFIMAAFNEFLELWGILVSVSLDISDIIFQWIPIGEIKKPLVDGDMIVKIYQLVTLKLC